MGNLRPVGREQKLNSGSQQKILMFSDIKHQLGGLEQVMDQICKRLLSRGFQIRHVTLDEVPTISGLYPNYPTANPFGLKSYICNVIQEYQPNAVFVNLIGMLGHMAGVGCHQLKVPYSVFYSAKIPEICKKNFYIPLWMSFYYLRKFFAKANNVFVPTETLVVDLRERIGSKNLISWFHAVDTERFKVFTKEQKEQFINKSLLKNKNGPFYLYVGRLTREKNIQAFLDLKLPGTKILVGEEGFGFRLQELRKKYPDVVFPGPQNGDDLVGYYACSDVFIFPSKTDTFGLVQLEALACGLSVVGFDVTGPKDVIPHGCGVGYLAKNEKELNQLAIKAWDDRQKGVVTPEKCRAYANQFSWDVAVDHLIENLPCLNWE